MALARSTGAGAGRARGWRVRERRDVASSSSSSSSAAASAAVAVCESTRDASRALSAHPSWLERRGDGATTTNPALKGNFAPVVGAIEGEVRDLRIDGALPACVDGVFMRNGPNAAREPALGTERYHWFDGDGMVHAVRLGGGRASYTRKYVETRAFKREEKANEALYTGLRDINPIWRYLLPRLVEKMTVDVMQPDSPFWVIQSKNTASNGLTYHAGRLLATYESGSAYELELGPTLATKGVCDFNGTFSTKDFWLDNMSAHGKICPRTGELIYIGYNLIAIGDKQNETTVTVGIIDGETGGRTYRREVKVERPSMQHDMAITSTKTVLLDGPLVFDLPRVIDGGLPFSFEKELTMRVGFMPRRARDNEGPYWIDTKETCFAYHVVNAYDEGSRIVLDVCKSDETNALGMCQQNDSPRSSPTSNPVNAGRDVAALWRWEIDTETKTLVSSRRMCDQTSDFPCINRAYIGLKYRYAYSVAYKEGTEPKERMDIPAFDAVLKHDFETGEVVRYDLGDGKTCGDIIFVSSDSPESEDDGYLLVLTHVLNEDEPRTELLLLHARTFAKQCVVHIPVRVPYGFHCEYVPGPLRNWPL